jgi:hypothetical protein
MSTAVLFVLIVTAANLVHADQNGHFTVTAQGPPITGQLTNSVIHQSTVTMTMVIDQGLPTKMGTVHIVGNGLWTGIMNNSTLTGTIGDVQGSAQACFLIFCQTADFTGTGTWTGTLNDAASGSGTFQGTLTFTGSPFAPSGPVPISGTWETSFQE